MKSLFLPPVSVLVSHSKVKEQAVSQPASHSEPVYFSNCRAASHLNYIFFFAYKLCTVENILVWCIFMHFYLYLFEYSCVPFSVMFPQMIARSNLVWTFWFKANPLRRKNHKLESQRVWSHARLEALCYTGLAGVWCTVFPHGLPGLWLLLATCEPGPLKAAKTSVWDYFTFFSSTTSFRPGKKQKRCRLICWCISQNHCRFYSIIYASVVCIKDGLNYTPSCCVFLRWKKKNKEKMAAKKAGLQQFYDMTSKLRNVGQLHLSQPEGTLSPPSLISTINTNAQICSVSPLPFQLWIQSARRELRHTPETVYATSSFNPCKMSNSAKHSLNIFSWSDWILSGNFRLKSWTLGET